MTWDSYWLYLYYRCVKIGYLYNTSIIQTITIMITYLTLTHPISDGVIIRSLDKLGWLYRKRKAQEDAEAEEDAKIQKEWNKNFEVCV